MAKIMIVDDSRSGRTYLTKIIESLNHEVIAQASSGEKALRLFMEMKPDVITMDLEMPGINGLETSKKILENDPEVNIIMITSISDVAMVKQAEGIGVRQVFQKPINAEKLEICFGRILGSRG